MEYTKTIYHVAEEEAKASASANALTIKGSDTEEAIRSAGEGIGYTFKGKV